MIKTASKAGFGGLLFLIFITLISTTAVADLKTEFQVSSGYTDNLYSEASYKEDSYEIGKFTLKAYPTSFMEVKFQAENTFYHILSDLSNFAGTAELTAVPLNKESQFSLYLNSGLTKRIYSYNFSSFDTDDFKFNLGLAYKISSTINARTGFSFKNTNYAEPKTTNEIQKAYDISRDTKNWEISGGVNYTFGGANTIDIETGIERMYLEFVQYPNDLDTIFAFDTTIIYPRDFLELTKDKAHAGNYDAFYFSTRFSRPIGNKTGLNLTYTYSKFNNIEDMVVPRLEIDFLSPWVSYFEGNSIALNIKSFIIPNYTILTGFGYWDKDFLKTEQERKKIRDEENSWVIKDRKDDQYKFYIGFKRTFVFKSGINIEMSLQFDYSDNESTNPIYYYNNKSVAFGMTVKM